VIVIAHTPEGTARAAGPVVSQVRAGGLSFRVARQGEGRPLVLLTGLGANLDMWHPFSRLLEGREVIAIDPPGAGGSQRPARPLRMSSLARVVLSLFDALGLDEVDVLGYSFGGALAQELARRAPGRVRRLILCATSPGLGSVPPNPFPALLLLSPGRYYHPGLLRLEVPRIAGGRTARDPGVLGRQAAARLGMPPDLLGYAYQLYAMTGWTSLPWLHRVAQPTLIIAGDDDPIIPVANARLMARLLPDARVRILEGAGHLLLLDQPETVVGDIDEFLDE
jgi:poly(3-hydroxyoctanoate) depolymerase